MRQSWPQEEGLHRCVCVCVSHLGLTLTVPNSVCWAGRTGSWGGRPLSCNPITSTKPEPSCPHVLNMLAKQGHRAQFMPLQLGTESIVKFMSQGHPSPLRVRACSGWGSLQGLGPAWSTALPHPTCHLRQNDLNQVFHGQR